jgi:hypothetical protein
MGCSKHQRGFLLIAAIVLLVVGTMLAVTLAFMVATSGSSASDNLKSGQALFLAESGLEYEQRQLAQNVDWYRATTDPFDVTTRNLGQGSFTISVNVPVTKLRTNMGTVTGNINVFTTNLFPSPSGTLLIDDDFTAVTGTAEFVTYNPVSAGSPYTFTLNGRNQLINSVGNTNRPVNTGFSHTRGTNVYPVTTLNSALPALPLATGACASLPTLTSLTITANSKFPSIGTITLYHTSGTNAEQISYSASTTSGGLTTLTGLTRCANNGTTAIAAAANDPVVSMVANVGTNDLEVLISSTGNAGSAQRREFKTVQRQ